MKTTRIILAAALALGAAFSAQAAGCKFDRATGQKVCTLPGGEHGWDANATMAVVNGQPVLVLLSNADANRIEADEMSLRIEGEEPFRLPVMAGSHASNCFWGVMLVGSCLPTSRVVVKLDAATMQRIADAPATYVAGAHGGAMGPNVKIKGSQMKAWLKVLPRYMSFAPAVASGEAAP